MALAEVAVWVAVRARDLLCPIPAMYQALCAKFSARASSGVAAAEAPT